MRTIQQIKSELTDAFMADATLAAMYGFTPGAEFDSTFSRVSIENLLLYIVAAAVWTHEKIFLTHRREVEEIIDTLKPHTLRWYVEKVKQFRSGQSLIDGTDQYYDTDLTADYIEQLQVVKFAAAAEDNATVYIKVATTGDEPRQPLDPQQCQALAAYIAQVKDAGVRVEIINEQACQLRLSLVIYYDPLLLNNDGQHLTNGTYPVRQAINDYIENLPFNSEYSNTALTDALQQAEGVKLPQVIAASESYDGTNFNAIPVRAIPYSGYYTIDWEHTNIQYLPY